MKNRHDPSWARVDQAVEAFETAFRSAGTPPDPFAPPVSDPLHIPVVVELLRADLEFAWSAGQNRRIHEYRTRFPAVFANPESLRSLAYEEYRLRVIAGEQPSPQEYRADYGVATDDWTDESSATHATAVALAQAPPGRFPEPDELFAGFRLKQELGRGAFARVYLAEQLEMAQRLVALKVSTQLRHESQTLARLQHTNIVPIYSTHTVGVFSAICMPYFGATTLADVLQVLHRRGSLPASGEAFASTVAQRRSASTVVEGEPETVPVLGDPAPTIPDVTLLDRFRHMTHIGAALLVAAELAEGLAFAHDRGFVHRDLKPANVLLADDGRPMLLDFNLAQTPEESSKGFAGGTPSHMSPEHLAAVVGEPATLDARSDLYSLGLILYELLTGRLPTDLPTGSFAQKVAALRQDRSRPPERASRFNRQVTPAIEAILARCLAPNPNDRYATSHQLSEDLRRQLADQPLKHTPEPSWRERCQKLIRRNPWLRSAPVLAAGLLLALVAVTGAVAYAWRNQERAQALEKVQAFQSRADAIQYRLTVPDPDPTRLQGDVQAARELLAAYRIPENRNWLGSSDVQRLDPDQAQTLRDRVADLLVGLAHAETQLAMRRPTEQADRLTQAQTWNAVGRDTTVDPVRHWVLESQRISLLELANQKAEAQDLRARLGPPPPGPTPVLHQFQEAYRRRDYRQALADLKDGSTVASTRPDYWYARGRTHAMLGQHTEAIAAYSTALAIQPTDNAFLFIARGLTHFESQDFLAACRDFDAALQLCPDDAQLLVNRGLARFRLGQYPQALDDLNQALAQDPGITRIYFIRQQVRLAMKDPKGAALELEQGLKATPSDETSWITRGVQRLARKDAAGALADFDEALKRNATSERALQNKAHVLSEHLKQPEEAVLVLDELVRLHPDSISGRAGRGVLLARLRQREAAHRDAREALQRSSAPFTKYQVAGIYALTAQDHPADKTEALRLLAQAFQAGAESRLQEGDHDLDGLRTDSQFRQLLDAKRTLETLSATKKMK